VPRPSNSRRQVTTAWPVVHRRGHVSGVTGLGVERLRAADCSSSLTIDLSRRWPLAIKRSKIRQPSGEARRML
jgi:hypothetical protein